MSRRTALPVIVSACYVVQFNLLDDLSELYIPTTFAREAVCTGTCEACLLHAHSDALLVHTQ